MRMTIKAINSPFCVIMRGNFKRVIGMARPTIYTEELRDEICERLSSGESLRSICTDEHIPHIATVLIWVTTDREGFFEHYARAREAQAHYHVDEMLDLRHDLLAGNSDPQAVRVVSDMIKWSAERMSRKSFGQKAPDNQEEKEQPVHRIEVIAVSANDTDKGN